MSMASFAADGIKALVFDVFGTLVDWRGSIARETAALLAPRGIATDWHAFADAWRAQYQPAMEEVRDGRIPFSKLDVLHRRNLDVVLRDLGLDSRRRRDASPANSTSPGTASTPGPT